MRGKKILRCGIISDRCGGNQTNEAALYPSIQLIFMHLNYYVIDSQNYIQCFEIEIVNDAGI